MNHLYLHVDLETRAHDSSGEARQGVAQSSKMIDQPGCLGVVHGMDERDRALGPSWRPGRRSGRMKDKLVALDDSMYSLQLMVLARLSENQYCLLLGQRTSTTYSTSLSSATWESKFLAWDT